jgi:hypothetical protein
VPLYIPWLAATRARDTFALIPHTGKVWIRKHFT